MAKNTHLEHLEDDILNNGSQGGKAAVAFLRSLGDMLSQGDGRMRVTTKWDGFLLSFVVLFLVLAINFSLVINLFLRRLHQKFVLMIR